MSTPNSKIIVQVDTPKSSQTILIHLFPPHSQFKLLYYFFWPTYPILCIMNELGCGDGCGYYWGIPIFLLPHNERPRKRQWPGIFEGS